MPPTDEPKKLTPALEFVVLRAHLEWKIGETVGERGEKGKMRQDAFSQASGISTGQVSAIRKRAPMRGLGIAWTKAVAYFYGDIETALREARKWRETAKGAAWLAESHEMVGPVDSEKVLEAVRFLLQHHVAVDDDVMTELRRLADAKIDQTPRQLAAWIEDWLEKSTRSPDEVRLDAMTRGHSSRPPSLAPGVSDLRKRSRK